MGSKGKRELRDSERDKEEESIRERGREWDRKRVREIECNERRV